MQCSSNHISRPKEFHRLSYLPVSMCICIPPCILFVQTWHSLWSTCVCLCVLEEAWLWSEYAGRVGSYAFKDSLLLLNSPELYTLPISQITKPVTIEIENVFKNIIFILIPWKSKLTIVLKVFTHLQRQCLWSKSDEQFFFLFKFGEQCMFHFNLLFLANY